MKKKFIFFHIKVYKFMTLIQTSSKESLSLQPQRPRKMANESSRVF